MGSGILNIDVITLFPGMFDALTKYGVTSRAVEKGFLSVDCWNPRDYTEDRHRTVDDRPYGGGPGMVMKTGPLEKTLDAILNQRSQQGKDRKVIYLSPQGRTFNHMTAKDFASLPGMVLLSGRYEGIDERFIREHIDHEVSIGDFVLTGGELPAMVLIDAVARLLPGVLGNDGSAEADSFVDGLLDCPHYTRPETYKGQQVPGVLLSGNHEAIRRWRLKQSLGQTWLRRPELLELVDLDDEQIKLLDEFKCEFEQEQESRR
ncbi:MAG TPA: tRNA (guanosine(37)-N1)-methyltransferase TrmD [Gammaproteobacteria bacterium]|nr:tRNA (guanosine(37)-N1)-methyltransferase TrmD [Gammaproteobacteria bacterium]